MQVLRALMTKRHSPKVHHSLLSVLHALRADSVDAPETHKEAVKLGPPWPAAIAKEFANHEQNGSWRTILRSEMPNGRRLHKFVWVFKLKRDGTAKARLCVQGCTLEAGVDYDQTFAKTLSHHSARGLFAYAAREPFEASTTSPPIWLGHLLAKRSSSLGLSETELCCAFVLRSRDHRSFGSGQGHGLSSQIHIWSNGQAARGALSPSDGQQGRARPCI